MSTTTKNLSHKECLDIFGGITKRPSRLEVDYLLQKEDFNKDWGWIGSGPGGEHVSVSSN